MQPGVFVIGEEGPDLQIRAIAYWPVPPPQDTSPSDARRQQALRRIHERTAAENEKRKPNCHSNQNGGAKCRLSLDAHSPPSPIAIVMQILLRI